MQNVNKMKRDPLETFFKNFEKSPGAENNRKINFSLIWYRILR